MFTRSLIVSNSWYFGQLIRMKYSCSLIVSNSWYFGQLTRKEAERALKSAAAVTGSFLIRESETSPGKCRYCIGRKLDISCSFCLLPILSCVN